MRVQNLETRLSLKLFAYIQPILKAACMKLNPNVSAFIEPNTIGLF